VFRTFSRGGIFLENKNEFFVKNKGIKALKITYFTSYDCFQPLPKLDKRFVRFHGASYHLAKSLERQSIKHIV
jgi:hypothetical protein